MTAEAHEKISLILDCIKYKDWWPVLVVIDGLPMIQWSWRAPCVNTKELAWQHSRLWCVNGMDEEAIIRTAFAAAKLAEEHECAENFNYKGRRIFDPHRSVL